ncbi:trans-sulfuration enzyme family protein [Flaviaesturariibacter aridisoli]|uniref:Aminotransferase class I/II-fold pyridoxal phosphate-dependent enzyme n=1 Tax=Flaviaesturariibacter aridisoli TaxID=2545761 RepID=A0A4R4E3S2_9BACT|nr:aminotransferase class I/II-fold pyridoxal phosphate-dependent enzyme [Flaviaesturariibacter aridisoli]TCZ73483.1 aminotransferase class I/II-fold pyridoxal phosphate-dependent enzyme [Flaviaesturariibacter aridisoli]
MELSEILNELGEDRSLYFNAVAPPLLQTSNFAFPTVAALRSAFADEMGGYIYSRGLNPTVDILRKKLAALDGAEDALLFANGAAAIFAGVLPFVKKGDHILSVRSPYSWAQKTFDQILPRFGIETTYIDGTDIRQFEEALRPHTTFIYLESPNSWNFALQPLAEVAALARARGIVTLIDNSYCTPLHQRPHELGIDLCMQTATKYIGGHSDTLGGVLTGTHERIRRIFELDYLAIGSGLSPFNAWLLLRGLRTLPVRLERISRSAATVLAWLKAHPKVDRVLYPLDPDFPQYDLARKQMSGAGGLFTCTLKGGTPERITRFCEALRHFLMAVSWGGHESLILPKCAGIDPAAFDPSNMEHQYIRMYVGLEEPEYLIRDLEGALALV